MTDDSFPLEQLPDGWELVPFEDCCSRISDNRDPSDCKGKRYLGLEHLASGFPSLVGVGDGAEIVSAKTAFRRDDILFGKLRPYLRKGLRVDFDGVCSTDIFAFRIKAKTRPDFLGYLIHAEPFARQAIKTTSGVNHPRTSWDGLRRFYVPRPPETEQRQIARLLSAVQGAIERQERLIALTVELKKALMHKLFTEGTGGEPLKPNRFGMYPASWLIVPLGECCEVQTGIAKGRAVRPEDAVAVPYLRVANVQDGHLNLGEMKMITIRKGELGRFSLRTGDVVLTEGGDLDKLGRGFIWNGEIAECVHQNHVFAVRPDPSKLSSDFIAYQTQSPYGKAYFLSVAHKTTNLACINTSKLKAFPVLLPTKEEQKEIVGILQSLDRRRDVTAKILLSMRSLFHTLLHQLMTAQLRVHDVDLSELNEPTPEPLEVA